MRWIYRVVRGETPAHAYVKWGKPGFRLQWSTGETDSVLEEWCRMRRVLLAALIAMGITVGTSGLAFAGTDSGSVVTHYESCIIDPRFPLVCYDIRLVNHRVLTPSGPRLEFSLAHGTVTSQGGFGFDPFVETFRNLTVRVIAKDGTQQVVHGLSIVNDAYRGVSGETCDSRLLFQYVDGGLRFLSYDITCGPATA